MSDGFTKLTHEEWLKVVFEDFDPKPTPEEMKLLDNIQTCNYSSNPHVAFGRPITLLRDYVESLKEKE